MNKIKVGILFGGKSAEHEVSLQSAKNVLEAMDRHQYEITLIGIDKEGCWYMYDQENFLVHADSPCQISLQKGGSRLAAVPGKEGGQLLSVATGDRYQLDVVFPVLHGTHGEDGTVQGLLKLLDIPFVGAGVLGSAVGMDKDVMKRLFREAGIPIGKFLVYCRWQESQISFDSIAEELGLPLFIKPANMGSSVGVSKVRTSAEFKQALQEAFSFDHKVIIEEFIEGREVECSVLGNEEPQASAVGEIVAQQDFYSYEAKYIDEKGAVLHIPAAIPQEVAEQIQKLAIQVFQVLGCEGLGRVDMFLTGDNRVLVNEINTLPGFTKISMYPKLWEVSGISYSRLIDTLIALALERHQKEKNLKISYEGK